MYLSVLNDIVDKLPHDSTRLIADCDYKSPTAEYDRHWKVSVYATDPGASMDEIISFMEAKNLTTLDYKAKSPTFPYKISSPDVEVWFEVFTDSAIIEFNEWGEIDPVTGEYLPQ